VELTPLLDTQSKTTVSRNCNCVCPPMPLMLGWPLRLNVATPRVGSSVLNDLNGGFKAILISNLLFVDYHAMKTAGGRIRQILEAY